MRLVGRTFNNLPTTATSNSRFAIQCSRRRNRHIGRRDLPRGARNPDYYLFDRSFHLLPVVSNMNENHHQCCDWVMSRSTYRYVSIASSPPDGSKPSVTSQSKLLTTTDSNNATQNNLLISAAKEAERLLNQSIHNKRTRKLGIESTSNQGKDVSTDVDAEIEREITNSLTAADSLLAASRPSSLLADAIINNNSGKVHTASIHRAFLTLTTQCLNCIDSILANDDPVNRKRVANLVERALGLSRSAHELSLPFHLPLYQRLINTVAQLYDPTRSLSKTILEISSWISASKLNVSVDANFFCTAILTLLKNYEFVNAANLIVGIRQQHDAQVVNVLNVIAIVLQLRDSVKEFIERSPSGTGRRYVPEKAVADIVSLLENSVNILTREQKMKFDIVVEALEDEETSMMLRSLQKDEVYELVRGMLAIEDLSEGDDDDDDDKSDNTTKSIDDDDVDYKLDIDPYEEVYKNFKKDANVKDRSVSTRDSQYALPLDHVIHEILVKTINNNKAKEMLSSVLRNSSRKSPGTNHDVRRQTPSTSTVSTASIKSKPNTENYQSSNNNEKMKTEESYDIAEESNFGLGDADNILSSADINDLYDDNDENNDSANDSEDDDFHLSDEYNGLLPDITTQFKQLNGGKPLRLTKQYKELLWARESYKHKDDDDDDDDDHYCYDTDGNYIDDDDIDSEFDTDNDDDDDDDDDNPGTRC